MKNYFNRLAAPGMQQRYFAMQGALDAARTPAEKTSGIPVMDMALYSKDPEAWSCVFVDSLSKNGFALLKNHGVPRADIEGAYESIHALNQEPEEELRRKYYVNAVGQRGYSPYGLEQHFSARNTNADKKTFFMFGREDMTPDDMKEHALDPNVWPDTPKDFREKLTALRSGMDRVQDIVMKAMSVGLGLEADFIPNMLRFGDHTTRTNYYPPLDGAPDTKGERSGEHSDASFATLLPAQRGLVVMPNKYDEKTWLYPESNPDIMVFNIGKGGDRTTKGFLPATYHKVKDPDDRSSWRASTPLFIWQDYRQNVVEIACPAPVNPSRSQIEVTQKLLQKFPTGTSLWQVRQEGLNAERLARGEKPKPQM